ncbi:MAG: CDGSH iron-sulfur domain-containing protein [Nocardioides sp.]
MVRLCGGSLQAQPGADVTVRACPDGPWLVRWADGVMTEDGDVHPTTRPVVAVCSCEKSQRLPWCDGTHKVIPRTASR